MSKHRLLSILSYREKLFKSAAYFIGAALLCGCATAPGGKFSQLKNLVPDKGDVYLYRDDAFFAIGDAFSISVDGQAAGSLYNASYLVLRLPPGLHSLKVAPHALAKSSVKEIDVKPGEASFWQFDFVTGPLANAMFIGSSIQSRDPALAVENMKALSEAATSLVTLKLPTRFATIADVDAVPGLDQRGKEGYLTWLSKSKPRAFVISATGKWNSAWGTKPTDLGDPKDPTERALLKCKKRGLNDCKVYALDENVVWEK